MIRYKKYQDNRKESSTNGLWYARAVTEQTYSLKDLAAHMAAHNTPFTAGTIYGVLRDMTDCIRELILEGKAIKIEDLCIFKAAISSTGAASAKAFTVDANVKAVRLLCLATGDLVRSRLALDAQLREYGEYTAEKQEKTSE